MLVMTATDHCIQADFAFYNSKNYFTILLRAHELKIPQNFDVIQMEIQSELKFIIHHYHKRRPFYYSFASMVIRPTVLILKRKFFGIVLP